MSFPRLLPRPMSSFSLGPPSSCVKKKLCAHKKSTTDFFFVCVFLDVSRYSRVPNQGRRILNEGFPSRVLTVFVIQLPLKCFPSAARHFTSPRQILNNFIYLCYFFNIFLNHQSPDGYGYAFVTCRTCYPFPKQKKG